MKHLRMVAAVALAVTLVAVDPTGTDAQTEAGCAGHRPASVGGADRSRAAMSARLRATLAGLSSLASEAFSEA